MGNTCSCNVKHSVVSEPFHRTLDTARADGSAEEQRPVHHCPDPLVYEMVRRNNPNFPPTIGQHHLLYKKGKPPIDLSQQQHRTKNANTSAMTPSGGTKDYRSTKLVIRNNESSQTHIYAVRSLEPSEQRPAETLRIASKTEAQLSVDPYLPQNMSVPPKAKGTFTSQFECIPSEIQVRLANLYVLSRTLPFHFEVNDWVCVSHGLDIYICDTGLSYNDCNALVQTTEQVCKGQYAAYTYAKQTLGCREFPVLAHACWDAVHQVIHSIWEKFPESHKLQLDDREPHIVKYDVTKKERQKLDMHTDKSEWTFLIALSDGCGLDYEGGGTFFEALDATVHLQRGHALIFPGKLRHCGQRITKGLRFLLVGFLVDKASNQQQQQSLLVSPLDSSISGKSKSNVDFSSGPRSLPPA